jgi:hypothetical protein
MTNLDPLAAQAPEPPRSAALGRAFAIYSTALLALLILLLGLLVWDWRGSALRRYRAQAATAARVLGLSPAEDEQFRAAFARLAAALEAGRIDDARLAGALRRFRQSPAPACGALVQALSGEVAEDCLLDLRRLVRAACEGRLAGQELEALLPRPGPGFADPSLASIPSPPLDPTGMGRLCEGLRALVHKESLGDLQPVQGAVIVALMEGFVASVLD